MVASTLHFVPSLLHSVFCALPLPQMETGMPCL
uniref:Uncharacterized protein n=1 Tax=Anguilla anguilla TaxID=7936 RepID=A0A0E9TVW3_ANGAN